jgi:hypothetical protein
VGSEGKVASIRAFFSFFFHQGWSDCLPCWSIQITTSATRFMIYDFLFIYYNEIMPAMSRRRGRV